MFSFTNSFYINPYIKKLICWIYWKGGFWLGHEIYNWRRQQLSIFFRMNRGLRFKIHLRSCAHDLGLPPAEVPALRQDKIIYLFRWLHEIPWYHSKTIQRLPWTNVNEIKLCDWHKAAYVLLLCTTTCFYHVTTVTVLDIIAY